MKSTQPSLVLIGLHDFLIFSNRTAHAWSVKAGNICSVSVFFVRVGSQISRRQAKKDSNIPSPERTGSVKCPIPGPTKTIKSPPHDPPPPVYIDRCIRETNFLGVILNENLNWKSEISHVANRVAKIQTSGSFYMIVIYFWNSKTIPQLNFERILVTDFCSNYFSVISPAYLLYQ